jgi:F-box and WD-40 domain protein 1/11
MNIIDQLPTAEVCEIVRRLRPRLYINFFQYLPPEVCLKVLGFLDPQSLINTARASREWMQLAMDRKLWEQLYILEGFRVYRDEVQMFEDSLNSDRSRSNESRDTEQPNKRRATPQRILPNLQADGDSEMLDIDSATRTTSLFGPSKQSTLDVDENMTDRSSIPSQWKGKSVDRSGEVASPEADYQSQSMSSVLPANSSPIANMSTLVVLDPSDNKKKLNWQYLYSQRRRLEANWESEKYINFQLPHPEHPYEAHLECIYTIQYSGKYLVSGSRDKTLRIWDLDTLRLVRKPLEAHTGSVLCLQFDASPNEDIIVSGSSDSTVIIWQFSTGKVIQRMRKAHRESVLNVRFDKRVLVTCSKDKTIKIFNRRPMSPGELGYPVLPGEVNAAPSFNLNNFGYNPAPTAGLVKPAWSMIGCLEGHGAAVNAVQIHGHEVVSASGDRTLKIWNWPEQTCTRTLLGHTKGIACVQYDGRRVVSGSSDNEVKVFDKESGIEVASLRAHTNLVRTVQVGFGDSPYSEQEDMEDAKATDNEYFKAVDAGIINRPGYLQRGRPRNAGSRKPEDITAFGAKIPPGGGGGKFGRIVSGSYDETIIIWKRDKEGIWRPMHTLRQEEAAHFASIAAYLRSNQLPPSRRAAAPSTTPAANQPHASASTASASSTHTIVPHSSAWYIQTINSAIQHGPAGLRQALRRYPQIITNGHLTTAINNAPSTIRQALVHEVQRAINHQTQLANPHSQPVLNPSTSASTSGSQSVQASTSTSTHASSSSSSQTSSAAAPTPQPQTAHHHAVYAPPVVQTPPQTSSTNPPPAQPSATPAPAPAPVPHHASVHHHLAQNMMRVYKLQFDARRIICCSQTPVIVGWDFANRDEQITEASRFFAPIE